MPPAKPKDRQKAYRLRDDKARGRRRLTGDELAWLAAFDRDHPPRGPRKKASLRGMPIEAASTTLRVESIPTARVADAAPPPPLEGDAPGPSGPPPTDAPVDPSAPPPLGAAAAEETAAQGAAPPVQQASGMQMGAAAALLGMFSAEVPKLAALAGYELAEPVRQQVDAVMGGAFLDCAVRFLPSGDGQLSSEMTAAAGVTVILLGPKLRTWVEKRRELAEREKTAIDMPPPQAPRAEVPPMTTRKADEAAHGY